MPLESVGIIKVEVSVPEAIRALEEFKNNRLKAFETLTVEVCDAVGNAITLFYIPRCRYFLGRPIKLIINETVTVLSELVRQS